MFYSIIFWYFILFNSKLCLPLHSRLEKGFLPVCCFEKLVEKRYKIFAELFFRIKKSSIFATRFECETRER